MYSNYKYRKVNAGQVYLNRRYSTPREYRVFPKVEEDNVLYKISLHLKRKRKSRVKVPAGMDAFWTVRKHKVDDGVQEKVKASRLEVPGLVAQTSINPVEKAYLKMMNWAKLPSDTNASLSRGLLKNYISFCTGNETFSQRFLQFFQFKSFMTFRYFYVYSQYLRDVNLRLGNLITFMLYDMDADGFVCQTDVFRLFYSDKSQILEPDFLKITAFVKNEPHFDLESLEEKYKIEMLILKDTHLTIKDYEMYFKKVEEPYMKAKSKKDTIFAKSFIVLDHRYKIRSTRKEMEIKKTMYNELMGEILGVKTKEVAIRHDMFRLDFGLFTTIFESESRYFRYFKEVIFGAV